MSDPIADLELTIRVLWRVYRRCLNTSLAVTARHEERAKASNDAYIYHFVLRELFAVRHILRGRS